MMCAFTAANLMERDWCFTSVLHDRNEVPATTMVNILNTTPVAQPQSTQWDVTGTTDAAPQATQTPLQWPSPSALSGTWPEPPMLPLKPPKTPSSGSAPRASAELDRNHWCCPSSHPNTPPVAQPQRPQRDVTWTTDAAPQATPDTFQCPAPGASAELDRNHWCCPSSHPRHPSSGTASAPSAGCNLNHRCCPSSHPRHLPVAQPQGPQPNFTGTTDAAHQATQNTPPLSKPHTPQDHATETTADAPQATPDTPPVTQPQWSQREVTEEPPRPLEPQTPLDHATETTADAPQATPKPRQGPSPSCPGGTWREPSMLPSLKPPGHPSSPSGLSGRWQEPPMLLEPPRTPLKWPSPFRPRTMWKKQPLMSLKLPQTPRQGPSHSRLSGTSRAPPWTLFLWPIPCRLNRTTRQELLLILAGWLMGDPSVEGRYSRTRPILMFLQQHSPSHSSRAPPGPQMPEPERRKPQWAVTSRKRARKVEFIFTSFFS